MRLGKVEVKWRVWIGLLFALVVTAAWWGWTRAKPPRAGKVASVESPFVRLTGVGKGLGDTVLREQAELFDPTPLFFPTVWNFGQSPVRETVRRQPGQDFGSFSAKLIFADQKIKSYGAEVSAAPEKLSDVLGQGNEAPFAGMGQVDVPRTSLSERSSFLEVRRIRDGKLVIHQALNGFTLQRMDFSPVEFLVVISSAGMVGDPVLASGSDFEEADTFFRSYLVKGFHLGERLDPGRYRILVGP